MAPLDMAPAFFADDPADLPSGYAKHFGDRDLRLSRRTKVSYSDHIPLREFCSWMSLAGKAVACSMPFFVSIVFLARGPTQIVIFIIGATAIPVSYFVFRRWRRTMKGHADELVNVHGFRATTKTDSESAMPFVKCLFKDLSFVTPRTANGLNGSVNRSYPSKVGDLITRMGADRLPFFCYIGRIHLALHSNGGQKPTVRSQRIVGFAFIAQSRRDVSSPL